jgi:hypothetical protein
MAPKSPRRYDAPSCYRPPPWDHSPSASGGASSCSWTWTTRLCDQTALSHENRKVWTGNLVLTCDYCHCPLHRTDYPRFNVTTSSIYSFWSSKRLRIW